MAELKLVRVTGQKPVRILKWLVKKGEWIKHGTPLAIYRTVEDPSVQVQAKEIQLKSKHVGRVKIFLMHEGQVAIPDGVLLEIEGCGHPVVMKDMCAECGQDLKNEKKRQREKAHSATVSMIPSIPELRISADQAEQIAQQDKSRLHQIGKLVLLVDLDQTLIHTTQDPGLAALCQSNEDMYSFQLSKNDPVLFTKLRPHCRQFIEEVSKRYELQIVTFGSRQYAHRIADFIDKEKKYFAHRILSRDECIHPFKKSGNLRHLFPCGDSMVCIIDDRDDVWNAVPNLIMVKKYNYFQGTGDINNPYKEGGKLHEKPQISETGGEQQVLGKRKFEEAKIEEDSCVKRSKKESENPVAKVESNRNNVTGSETVKSDVSDDLDLSSDSSSDSSSSESDVNGSQPQFKSSKECGEEKNTAAETVDIGSKNLEKLCDKQSEECGKDSEKSVDDKNQSEVVVHGGENQPDLGRTNQKQKTEEASSGETDWIPSSQDSELKESNSQDIEREVSGFSGLSQDFTAVVSSQEGSVCVEDSRNRFHDSDDYLPYLKDILLRIHDTYYEAYNKYLKKEFDNLPDVRGIVPFLRSKVLYGCSVVFTGIIPQTFHLPPHAHRAHITARQLGARVEDQVTDETTHLVAAKKGTTKYQDVEKRKHRNIKIVAVEWLWCCSERWEKVDERLFPVSSKLVENTTKSLSMEASEPVSRNIPVNGKVQRKVKEPRLNFMVRESKRRLQEGRSEKPLYSSLLISDAVVPIPLRKEESVEIPRKWKHDLLSKSKTAPSPVSARSRKRSMAEIVGYGYSLSMDDIADMDKEINDLLGSSDEEEYSKDSPQSSRDAAIPTRKPPLLKDSSKEEGELGTLIGEFKDSPTLQKKDEESSSSDEEEASEESEDDEMEALLNAEMHYDDDEED